MKWKRQRQQQGLYYNTERMYNANAEPAMGICETGNSGNEKHQFCFWLIHFIFEMKQYSEQATNDTSNNNINGSSANTRNELMKYTQTNRTNTHTHHQMWDYERRQRNNPVPRTHTQTERHVAVYWWIVVSVRRNHTKSSLVNSMCSYWFQTKWNGESHHDETLSCRREFSSFSQPQPFVIPPHTNWIVWICIGECVANSSLMF